MNASEVKLERRQCAAPKCSTAFRAMTTSKQKYCSTFCEYDAEPGKFRGGLRTKPKAEDKPKLEVVKSEPKPLEVTHDELVQEDSGLDDKLEERWTRYVTNAKGFVKAMQQNRMDIAKCAVEATNIEGNGYGRGKKFTVEKFSQEIGVNYKTLLEWIQVYRNVVAKLPEGTYTGKDFEAFRRTRQRVEPETPPAAVARILEEEKSRNMDSHYFVQSMKRVRTLKYFICNKADLSQIPWDELAELLVVCESMTKRIKEFQTKGRK